MAESKVMEALKTPPFANYDLVVYFGAGLFLVPFVNRYILEPINATWPNFDVKVGSSIAQEATAILSLLFTIYIVGHILAYVASQLVEKLFDRLLGKTSTAIYFSASVRPGQRNRVIRKIIYNRLSNMRRDGAILPTLVRAIFHIPIIPVYLVIFGLGIFGYYGSRVPREIMAAANSKLKGLTIAPVAISSRTRWYKPLEYYVMNRHPNAIPRMYNYLVISGLFRSLSLIFLFSVWMVSINLLHFWRDGDWLLKPFLGKTGAFAGLLELSMMVAIYFFCLFSYLKFQRRYAEEAIFAFVYSE